MYAELNGIISPVGFIKRDNCCSTEMFDTIIETY